MIIAAYALADKALLAVCTLEVFRSGGPGGQHTNRTASAVRLTHSATGATAQCQDHREQGRNLAAALRRLRLRLAGLLRGAADPGVVARHRRGAKLLIGANGNDYPLVAAACLDALHAAGGSLPAAAASLELSSSQLVKALVADADIRAAADRIRAEFALSPMRG